MSQPKALLVAGALTALVIAAVLVTGAQLGAFGFDHGDGHREAASASDMPARSLANAVVPNQALAQPPASPASGATAPELEIAAVPAGDQEPFLVPAPTIPREEYRGEREAGERAVRGDDRRERSERMERRDDDRRERSARNAEPRTVEREHDDDEDDD